MFRVQQWSTAAEIPLHQQLVSVCIVYEYDSVIDVYSLTTMLYQAISICMDIQKSLELSFAVVLSALLALPQWHSTTVNAVTLSLVE